MTLTPLCAGVWWTYVKIHSADLGFRGLFKKFIPRTSDFADFCKNSFRGPRISRTSVKIHSADLAFRGLLSNSFRGPLISRTFAQVREVRGIHLALVLVINMTAPILCFTSIVS